MNYKSLITQEWFKGGVEAIRDSRSSRHHQFYLRIEPEDSEDNITYYSVCYDPNKFNIKVGDEYVFCLDIIHPFSKEGTITYILKGLIRI